MHVKNTNRKVAAFLKEFKEVVGENELLIKPNDKNFDALADLGLTKIQRKREILSLSVEDYCSGPEPDRDNPGNIWIFGKMVNGAEIYIKIKISYRKSGRQAICLSFHRAEHPLHYPLKSEQS